MLHFKKSYYELYNNTFRLLTHPEYGFYLSNDYVLYMVYYVEYTTFANFPCSPGLLGQHTIEPKSQKQKVGFCTTDPRKCLE